jgi:uncharacterized RDD family membrane protein YckC
MSSPDNFHDQFSGQLDDSISVDTPEQIALEFPLAGIGSRFMAMLLDTLIHWVLFIAGIFALAAVEKYAPSSAWLFGWIPASWLPAVIILFLFCLEWGYFAFFEMLWNGRTPGKRAAGIRVIKDSGRALNAYEAIGRNLLRAIDGMPLFPLMFIVGAVTMMITRRHQRLGDLVAGSIVVHDKKAEEVRPDWSSSVEKTVASPQLAKISPEELVLIETYLHRRNSLDFAVRDATAHRIASRITAKTGIERPLSQSLDEFLESIAQQLRETAGFRT